MENIVDYIYLHSLLVNASEFFDIDTKSHVKLLCDSYVENLSDEQIVSINDVLDRSREFTIGNHIRKNADKQLFLSSLLVNIGKDTSLWRSDAYSIPLRCLELSKRCFPVKGKENVTSESLKEGFKSDLGKIKSDILRVAGENVLSLLFKYAQNVPVPFECAEDISLYDYCRVAASLSVCLYKYGYEGSGEPFLLVGGDFSGIQPYIYQIVSKYAGKNLKGRSFYIRLLSDAIARFLLQRLGLYQSNVLYNSGGSFYLIAPNTEETKNNLQSLMQEIEKKLFDSHRTILYSAIDYVVLECDALMHKDGKSLHNIWDNLFKKRDLRKSSKFHSLIESNYSDFFVPSKSGGEAIRDVITGEEIQNVDEIDRNSELGALSNVTYSQIELGKELRDSEFILITDRPVQQVYCIEPARLGIFYSLFKTKDLPHIAQGLKGIDGMITIISLNDKELCPTLRNELMDNVIYSHEFYGGNKFNNKTFDELCEKSDDAYERLGVLRMDVDNLGSLFQQGICAERANLARYATFSRLFDFFFSGYLNVIQQEIAPDTSYIVYSGGDDLFIVGSWEDTIRMAERIHDDFREYTCGNEVFSISGGIAVVSPKYPIMKGADESAVEEANAKNHQCCGKTKNSISFMGQAFNWDLEYPVVKSLKDRLICLSEKEALPKSLISKLVMYASNAGIVDHQITKLNVFWMLTYDLSRMIERQTPKEAKELIERCKTEICSNRRDCLNGETIKTAYHPLELWAFAARWAELEMRTSK